MTYTDWSSGEPVEKEWAMTGPTDPALRALEEPTCPFCGHREHLADVCETDLGEHGECQCADTRYRDLVEASGGETERYQALERFQRDRDLYNAGYAAALAAAEAAPLDVERLSLALISYGTFDYDIAFDAAKEIAGLYAALRSPDPETAEDGL